MKTYSCNLTRTALLLACASLPLGAATVHADDNGFYLGASAGVNFASDVESNFGLGSTSLHPGVRANLFTGYAFGLGAHLSIAPELEAGFTYNSFDNGVNGFGQSVSGGGNLTQVPVLVNVVLNWHFAPQWNTYAGVGLGVEYFDVSTDSSGPQEFLATQEGSVAWQIKAGIEHKLGPGNIGLGYEYLGSATMWYNNMGNHTIMASYTIHF